MYVGSGVLVGTDVGVVVGTGVTVDTGVSVGLAVGVSVGVGVFAVIGVSVGTGVSAGTKVAVGGKVAGTVVGAGSLPQATDTVTKVSARITKATRTEWASVDRYRTWGTPLQLGIAASCHSRLDPVCAGKGARRIRCP